MIIYNRLLSAPEIQQVNNYLFSTYFIPEPSTLMLLGVGGACLYRWRKRR